MISAIIILILSFLTEGFMSNYFYSTISNSNPLTSLYLLIALTILYPYFYNKKKYYILLIIFGLLFDLVYTNTFIFSTILFIIISLEVKLLTSILPFNIFMINIISIITVTLYHILTFFVLTIVNYGTYNFNMLLSICSNSILMTIIYTTILYLITNIIYHKETKIIK